jgi:hypothetical protein
MMLYVSGGFLAIKNRSRSPTVTAMTAIGFFLAASFFSRHAALRIFLPGYP